MQPIEKYLQIEWIFDELFMQWKLIRCLDGLVLETNWEGE